MIRHDTLKVAALLVDLLHQKNRNGGGKDVICIRNKKELTNLEVKDCCTKAELSALIRMNGSLSFLIEN